MDLVTCHRESSSVRRDMPQSKCVNDKNGEWIQNSVVKYFQFSKSITTNP